MANGTKNKPTHFIDSNGLLYTSNGTLDARFDVTDIDRARARYRDLQEEQAKENIRKANELYLKAKRIRQLDEGIQALLITLACAVIVLTIHYAKYH